MRELFAEFLDAVKTASPRSARLLRPGLSAPAIKRKLKSLPFRISPDAEQLYQWADGSEHPFEMLPGDNFLSLKEAISDSKMFYELNALYPQKHGHFLRFLTDQSDGGFGFGSIDSASKGRIVMLCIHAEVEPAFADLTQLLKTAIECYRRKSTQPGRQDVNINAYFKLAARMNPTFKVWTS